jgi:DMSO/TMAO reductase YedYZ heme-binding membrane subunit
MYGGQMNYLIVLACTVAGAFLIAKPLRKHPVVFYSIAVLLNALYVAYMYTSFAWPGVLRSFLIITMQRCTLALALLMVVMFIGVFQKESKISLLLRPARAEFSIMACILALGHMVVYLMAYVPRFANLSTLNANFLVFFATAVILLILLLLLGVSSFRVIRLRMNTTSWRRLQKWAYPFFGLIYLHLISILLPPALANGEAARISVAVYTVLFILYAALRIRRWHKDKGIEAVS